jgi:hypothetical protein
MAERKPRTTTKKSSTEAGETPARRKTPKRISGTGAAPKTTTKSRAKKAAATAGDGEASAAVPKTTTKSRTRKKAAAPAGEAATTAAATSSPVAATRSAPAAAKPAARPTAAHGKKKPAASAAPSTSPLVDTNLAAQVAARALATRAKLGAAIGGNAPMQPAAQKQQQQPPARESGGFKQFKENLNKPAGSSLGNVLGNVLGHSKSNLPTPGRNESFHSQTQGAGPKFNVPRRTGG